jgi:broad specificity phosphatase PhoE
MKLLLIRHGESIANTEGRLQGQLDSPLSDRGREQARALAARLLHERRTIAAIYASDLSRSAETAEILATGLSAPLHLDARLREYDVGDLTGVIWSEVEFLFPELWQRLHEDGEYVAFPGEEGNEAFHARIAAVLAGIQARHSDGDTVAVVGHGGSLGMLLAHLLGMDTRRPLPFRFGNASLSIVEAGGRRLRLTLLNDTCHLDDDLR